MKWIDFEKEQPKIRGLYLCEVWGFSCNQYGSFSEVRILFWHGSHFGIYPYIERSEGTMCGFTKVVWWCEIERPPINPDHYKSREEIAKLYPVEDDEEYDLDELGEEYEMD